MGWFEEERAAAFHLALGIEECPTPEDRGRVIDLLGDLLIIEHGCRIDRARYVEIPGHRGLVLLPRGINERALDESAFHEATHYLLRHGAGWYFRRYGDMDDPRERALADYWEEHEEREVEEFLLAFLIPARLVYMIRDDHDLAELTGCAVSLVQRRRQRLRGKVVELRQPPAWSAYPHFWVSIWKRGGRPSICVGPYQDDGTDYEIPTNAEDLADLQWRINVELICFTLDEFRAKYRRYQGGPAVDGKIPLPELRAWGARLGRRESLG